MKLGLQDKVIVVTGAATGIGRAIATMAADEGVGGLILTDRNGAGCATVAADLARQTEIGVVVADLGDIHAPEQIATGAKDRFGRIDGLVNAAGLTTRGSVATGSAEVWDRLFAVNARAGFFLMQSAIEDMRTRGASGSIVNILSMNAHCGIPELGIYAGTKGAMQTLTRNAAHAHMADRIRVNGINLGWVATDTERHLQETDLGRGHGWLEAEAAKKPLGRLVTPEECAKVAVFLLGEASVPMSGAIIDLEQFVAGAI
jgi:NAD(P)-dependent dehydrogenase (short-subunit alcohol dehydrogenase family)